MISLAFFLRYFPLVFSPVRKQIHYSFEHDTEGKLVLMTIKKFFVRRQSEETVKSSNKSLTSIKLHKFHQTNSLQRKSKSNISHFAVEYVVVNIHIRAFFWLYLRLLLFFSIKIFNFHSSSSIKACKFVTFRPYCTLSLLRCFIQN